MTSTVPVNTLLDLPTLHSPSPAWSPAHDEFRQRVRSFVQRELTPAVVDEAERNGRVKPELVQAAYRAGLFSMRAPAELGGTPPKGAVLDRNGSFDQLYDVALVQEMMRGGSMGIVTELMGNFNMVRTQMVA
jgi:alkylation response protein AidB-like acyl-CoA dehydrogenase